MFATRRDILGAAVAGGAALTLGGCEKLVSKVTQHFGQNVPEHVAVPTSAAIDPIHHLLNRAGYGPWPGDVERVRAMGAEAWIDQQLDYAAIPDNLCDLRARRADFDGNAGECYEYTKPVLREEMARRTLLGALYSKRQLYEVMVAFWTDHLNINIEKGDCIYLKPWDDQHVIRKHALGNFRDLIRSSATSPAMLIYLDGAHNTRAHPSDVPNENYARELLELHTLGIHGGYTQRDVYETARALTGWRVRTGFMKGSVHFVQGDHDQESKNILGQTLPAGQNERDLDALIDIVCRHPSTAKNIATKLARRFVADDPPADLVEKAAAVFRDSDGDIRKTVKTVLTSEAFRASAGVKFKPPFRFVVSALRAVGADTHAHLPLIAYLSRMGQGVFEHPTPDGYPDKISPWLGTLLWRWNFGFALAANQIPATQTPLDRLAAALGATGADMSSRLFEHCAGHAPSPEQIAAMTEMAQAPDGAAHAVEQALGLVLSAPSFQMY